MSPQGLFKGVAVVIDDELAKADSEIFAIVDSIKHLGGHVIGMTALPNVESDLQNFKGAAFFIMDWQLHGDLLDAGDANIRIPAVLAKRQLKEKIEFLKNLKKTRFAPVFIFTNDDPEDVKDALHRYEELYQRDQPSHIFVLSKSEVIKRGVFSVLNDWIQATPSALVLKTWEEEYERAKNAMFAEFYNRSIYWPVLLWKTFDKDGVPASDELGRVISRNLFSRMTPFHLDLTKFSGDMDKIQRDDPTAYQKTLLRVLEGERFVRRDGLHDDSVAPGDVFKFGGAFWINIRPDCDCVIRGDAADVELYLLKGSKLSSKSFSAAIDVERGAFSERDDEVIIFSMFDEQTVSFKLRDIYPKNWKDIKKDRIGRLLSPFLTRVQQRYSGYIQRPGLPKIPKAALPFDLVVAAEQEASERASGEMKVKENTRTVGPLDLRKKMLPHQHVVDTRAALGTQDAPASYVSTKPIPKDGNDEFPITSTAMISGDENTSQTSSEVGKEALRQEGQFKSIG